VPANWESGVVWVSAIRKFKRRCLDLDGNTKLKSKAGRYGNDSSIVSSAVQFADRKFQAEKFNERLPLFAPFKADQTLAFTTGRSVPHQ